MSDAQTHRYTLHTSAGYEVVRELAPLLAMRSGCNAMLREVPDDHALIARPRVWNSARWLIALGTLAGSSWFFHHGWPSATNVQGFGLGFIVAAVVLLGARREREL